MAGAETDRRTGSLGRRILDAALSVAFPPRCVHCGDFEEYLCPRCRDELEPVGPEVCPRCGAAAPEPAVPEAASAAVPAGVSANSGTTAAATAAATSLEIPIAGTVLPGASPLAAGPGWGARHGCAACVTAGHAFVAARSAFVYGGPAKSLVAAVKGGRLRAAADVMARVALPAFEDLVRVVRDSAAGRGQDVVLTWVPAHSSVHRVRGYNQAELIARGLALHAARRMLPGSTMPVVATTRKSRRTSQQKGLDRRARRSNVAGAFVPERATVPEGAGAIILVDDVYTTGVTVGEVSSVVRRSTGLPVYVFTVCRTLGGTSMFLD